MTRLKKRIQQSRAAGRLGGRPKRAVNEEHRDEAHSAAEWSVDGEEAPVEEVNGKVFLNIFIEVKVI